METNGVQSVPVRCTFPSSLNFLRIRNGNQKKPNKISKSKYFTNTTRQDQECNVNWTWVMKKNLPQRHHARTLFRTYWKTTSAIVKRPVAFATTSNSDCGCCCFSGPVWSCTLDRSGSNHATNRCVFSLKIQHSQKSTPLIWFKPLHVVWDNGCCTLKLAINLQRCKELLMVYC